MVQKATNGGVSYNGDKRRSENKQLLEAAATTDPDETSTTRDGSNSPVTLDTSEQPLHDDSVVSEGDDGGDTIDSDERPGAFAVTGIAGVGRRNRDSGVPDAAATSTSTVTTTTEQQETDNDNHLLVEAEEVFDVDDEDDDDIEARVQDHIAAIDDEQIRQRILNETLSLVVDGIKLDVIATNSNTTTTTSMMKRKQIRILGISTLIIGIIIGIVFFIGAAGNDTSSARDIAVEEDSPILTKQERLFQILLPLYDDDESYYNTIIVETDGSRDDDSRKWAYRQRCACGRRSSESLDDDGRERKRRVGAERNFEPITA